MRQRYTFVVFLLLLIAGTGWWAKSIHGDVVPVSVSSETSESPASDVRPQNSRLAQNASLRRELLETLDRLVAYQLYYRGIYGRFTKILNRVGISIPRQVAQVYEIHVMEATSERLLVAAFSEADGRIVDQLSINQDFDVHANFKLPIPRPEYLRAQATRHLRLLRESMTGKEIEERGVFKDYFRYDVRNDSEERKVAFAVGIRPPVVGMQLEFGPAQSAEHSPYEGVMSPFGLDMMDLPEVDGAATVGQGMGSDVMTSGEEAHLAQKIFHGEMGRYAKTLSELSRIASFQFESPKDEDDSALKNKADKKTTEAIRQIGSLSGGLEIEPIDSDSEN